MLRDGQQVRVNLAGMRVGSVVFHAAVTDAVGTIVRQVSENPPTYLVKFCFLFAGWTRSKCRRVGSLRSEISSLKQGATRCPGHEFWLVGSRVFVRCGSRILRLLAVFSCLCGALWSDGRWQCGVAWWACYGEGKGCLLYI